jgi:transposase-like protein
MITPLADVTDESACYEALVALLHREGLACPRCRARDGLKVHRRHRAPVLDYRCAGCGRVFNAFTGTAFHKTHRRPSEILQILRGIARGEPTARLARALNRHRPHLLRLRHRLEAQATCAGPRPPGAEPPPAAAVPPAGLPPERCRSPPVPGRPPSGRVPSAR